MCRIKTELTRYQGLKMRDMCQLVKLAGDYSDARSFWATRQSYDLNLNWNSRKWCTFKRWSIENIFQKSYREQSRQRCQIHDCLRERNIKFAYKNVLGIYQGTLKLFIRTEAGIESVQGKTLLSENKIMHYDHLFY